MRALYSSWPGTAGLGAWNVRPMTELSADLPVRDVPLSALWEINPRYWGPDVLGAVTVRWVADHARLVWAVDPSCSNFLAVVERVMDGIHRDVRALVGGRDTIAAVQFVKQPDPDFSNCSPDLLPYDDW